MLLNNYDYEPAAIRLTNWGSKGRIRLGASIDDDIF